MCYSGCPYEDWHGNCANTKAWNSPKAHCYEVPEDEEDVEDVEETEDEIPEIDEEEK